MSSAFCEQKPGKKKVVQGYVDHSGYITPCLEISFEQWIFNNFNEGDYIEITIEKLEG